LCFTDPLFTTPSDQTRVASHSRNIDAAAACALDGGGEVGIVLRNMPGIELRLMCRPSLALRLRTALLALLLLVGGCIEPSPRSDITQALNDVSFAPPPPTAPGAAPGATGIGPQQAPEPPLQPQIYRGRPVTPQRPATGGAQRSADGVQLNFEQAEIRDVVKVILGDILGRSYTVDSDVQGQVTLSTSAPMSESDLVAVLETVLRANGATLVESNANTFRVMPVDAAIGRSQVVPLGGRPVQVRPGYGITIVPLRNISATSAAQFIQPLVASPEDIRIDPGRNAILFSGTGIERENVVETLADLDVDWMAGKAIGLFPLERANVEAVVPELQAIFAPFDPTGAEPSLIRFLPLARLNAVLAIAGDPDQIREVGSWVSRLDRGQAVGPQFYVYNLKHGAAEDVAKLLNEAFSEGQASDAGPSLAAASASLGAAPGGEDGGEGVDAGGFGETPAVPPTTPDESTTLSGPVKVVASRANNSLLIRATPEEYDRIDATLARLDTAPWQVLIEATIAEVTLNDTLRYGVQYFLEQGSFAGGFTRSALANSVGPLLAPGFSFLFTPGSSQITIDALSRLTDVKVLSAPSVVVQDNSEAVLNVGQEVPVQTQQQQSLQGDANILNSIEYRDTGVILEVRPRINSNQAVSLEIAQEVSRCDNCEVANNLNPTFTQRKITSRVNVQSGQTVVLGGLIQDSEERGRDRVPILGEIPVVGNLFGTTSNVNIRTELIVFITPRVIRNPEDARDVSEELRSRLRSLRQSENLPLGVNESYPPPVPTPQRPPSYPQPLVVPRGQPLPDPYGLSPAPAG
jgi:general secretion pathway protein D